MEKKTEGAWVINHTKKLLDYRGAAEFEDIEFAGKCGIFLSNLAASHEQSELDADKVKAVANVSDVKKSEISTVIETLQKAHLIDSSKSGAITVLGVSTSSVLSHTSDIFKSFNPSNYQKAAIALTENVSETPQASGQLKEKISDTYKLSTNQIDGLVSQAEGIGLIDFEKIDSNTNIYFNGNLFRRESIKKTEKVLASLKSTDVVKVSEVDQLLSDKGCIDFETAKNILGGELLSKLQSIAMYDFNEVSNTNESKILITKPSAFAKFGNPFEEDAFDLAKAFVSALYYGMNYSTYSRGQITSLRLLLEKLIRGDEIGPAPAIGEDYKILEYRRVVQIRRKGYSFAMRLLKKDIGILALQVLEKGNATDQTVLTAKQKSVSNYNGPEELRTAQRKKQMQPLKSGVADLIRTFRTI